MDLKPGVIPLRPLQLGDIYNGAVNYIRANPKATLGLTAVVVVIAQAIIVLFQLSALTQTSPAAGEFSATASDLGELVGQLVNYLATLVLTGMLTVVVGRAVFGSPITAGEAWHRVRGRILPLIGYSALVFLAVALSGGLLVLLIWLAASANGIAGFLVALLLGLPYLAALLWFGANLMFTPVAIVLEQQPVFAAIRRSFALVRGDFWRVLGIWLLTAVITAIIVMIVVVPFALVGGIFAAMNEDSTAAAVLVVIVVSIGGIIGSILTTPFSAGVTVLLYTDRRMRAEAFDLVLRTGAGPGQGHASAHYPASTDQLWLVRH